MPRRSSRSRDSNAPSQDASDDESAGHAQEDIAGPSQPQPTPRSQATTSRSISSAAPSANASQSTVRRKRAAAQPEQPASDPEDAEDSELGLRLRDPEPVDGKNVDEVIQEDGGQVGTLWL